MDQGDWTESKCLQLIHEFKERPILWDKKNSFFYKKEFKPAAWHEIADILNISSEICKHKMDILMSSFRREKAKLVNPSKRRDPSSPFHSTWFAYKAMSFLLDKDKLRKRESIEILDDEDSERSNDGDQTTSTATENLLVEDFQQEVEPLLEKDECIRPRKRQAMCENISVKNDQILKAIPAMDCQPHPSTSQQNADEINYFSRFVASKMMKYSENTKNAVQQAICDIIFKADQRCLAQNTNEMCARSDPVYQPSSVTEQQPSSSDFCIKSDYSDSE